MPGERTARTLSGDEVAGLVPRPGSPVWRYAGDARLLTGAGYALLLQVAHPTVGAGVSEHSDFKADPWGRLFRTLDYSYSMVYGGPELAGEIGRRVFELHKGLKGVKPDGERYHALEPEAYPWVHATLAKSIVTGNRRFALPMPADEIERFWSEWRDLGPRRWAEAYVDFAAGEKRSWLRAHGIELMPNPGWAERGGYLATGPGNSVPLPRHLGHRAGRRRAVRAAVREAAREGLVTLRFRHRVDELTAWADVRGTILEPSGAVRGEPSSRTAVAEFELGPRRQSSPPAASARTTSWCWAAGPSASGTHRSTCSSARPTTSTAGCSR